MESTFNLVSTPSPEPQRSLTHDREATAGRVDVDLNRPLQALGRSDAETESNPNWPQITRSMQRGDTEAFATFYRQQFDTMLREAKRCSGLDEPTCLDLVQDAMLKAIKSIKPMESSRAVAAWSKAVVKTVTWDWFRQQKRRPNTTPITPLTDTDSLPNRLGDLPAQHDPLQESALETTARIAWLEEEIRSLPVELQTMISLRYRIGWSLQRIANHLGLKTGAVDGRIRRAVERIKRKASQEYESTS